MPWSEVLEFWFPEERSGQIDAATHKAHWLWRMRGGADGEIMARFSELTAKGGAGDLDHWAADFRGRLALIIVLDQFSRAVWRGTARAFAQDSAALTLSLEGISNGHYAELETPWARIVHGLPLGHCEGEGHLDQIDMLIALREEIAAEAPDHLKPIYRSLVRQARTVREVIAAFGRHPHRNHVLRRASSPAEQDYIDKGQFPHLRAFEI